MFSLPHPKRQIANNAIKEKYNRENSLIAQKVIPFDSKKKCMEIITSNNITYRLGAPIDSNDEIEIDENTYQLYSDFTHFISMSDNEFENIIKNAESLIKDIGSNYVFDEHLFYSMLEEPSNVGVEILILLGLNIDEVMEDIEDIYNFYLEDKDDPYPYLTNLSKNIFFSRLFNLIKLLFKLTIISFIKSSFVSTGIITFLFVFFIEISSKIP